MTTAPSFSSGALAETALVGLGYPTLSPAAVDGQGLDAFAEKQIPSVVQTLLERRHESPEAQSALIENMATTATADQRGHIVQGLLGYQQALGQAWQEAGSSSLPLPEGLAKRGRELARITLDADHDPSAGERRMAGRIVALLRDGEYAAAGKRFDQATVPTAAQITRSLLARHDTTTPLDQHALVRLAPHVQTAAFKGLSAGVWLHERMNAGALIEPAPDSGRPASNTAALVQRLGQLPPADAAQGVLQVLSAQKPDADAQREFFRALVGIDIGKPQWMQRQLQVAQALLLANPAQADDFALAVKAMGPPMAQRRFEKQWQAIRTDHTERQALGPQADEVVKLLGEANGGKRVAQIFENLSPTLRSQLTKTVLEKSTTRSGEETLALLEQKIGTARRNELLEGGAGVLQDKLVAYQNEHSEPVAVKAGSTDSMKALAKMFGADFDQLDASGREIVGKIHSRVRELGGGDTQVTPMGMLYIDEQAGKAPQTKALALVTDKEGIRHAVDENGSSFKLNDKPGVSEPERFRDLFENSPFVEGARLVIPKNAKAAPDEAGRVDYFMHKAHTPDWMERIANPLNVGAGVGALAATVGVLAPTVFTLLCPEVAIPMWIMRGAAVAAPLMMASNAAGLATSLDTVTRKQKHGQDITGWDALDATLNVTGMAEAATLGRAGMLLGEVQHLRRNAHIAHGLGDIDKATAFRLRSFALSQTARPLGQIGRVFENAVVHKAQMVGNAVSMGHGVIDLWQHSAEMEKGDRIAAWSTMLINGGNMALSATAHAWIKHKTSPTPHRSPGKTPDAAPDSQTASGDAQALVPAAALAEATATATEADNAVPAAAEPIAAEQTTAEPSTAEPAATQAPTAEAAKPEPTAPEPVQADGTKAEPAQVAQREMRVYDVEQSKLTADGPPPVAAVGDESNAFLERLKASRSAIDARLDGVGRKAAIFDSSAKADGGDPANASGAPGGAKPEAVLSNARPPKLRIGEADVDTPVKARQVSEKYTKLSDEQQRAANALQDELHHGTEALGMLSEKIDRLRQEAFEAEVLAEAQRGTDSESFFAKRAQGMQKQLAKDTSAFESLSHKLLPVLVKLDVAVTRNAQLKAEAAMALLAHKTFEHLKDANEVTEDDLAVLETSKEDTFHNIQVIRAQSAAAVREFKHHLEHHLTPAHGLSARPSPGDLVRMNARVAEIDKLLPETESELKRCEAAFEEAIEKSPDKPPADWTTDQALAAIQVSLGTDPSQPLNPSDIAAALAGHAEGSIGHAGMKLINERARIANLRHELRLLQHDIAEAAKPLPPVVKAAPGGRRVFDVAAANAQVERAGASLKAAEESLKSLMAELLPARAEELRAVKTAGKLWNEPPDPVTGVISRESKRLQSIAADEARGAVAAVDYINAHSLRLMKHIKELSLAHDRAKSASIAVKKAVDSLRTSPGPAASVHNADSKQAAIELQQFDEQSRVVHRLLHKQVQVDWRRPRLVEGVITYGTLPNQRPGDPDIREGFKPNPVTTEDHAKGSIDPRERNKRDLQWLSKLREKWVLKLTTPAEKFNAYELMSGQSRPQGAFALDPLVKERAEIPGGLEEVPGDGHTHGGGGYDGRAALLKQRDGLRFIDNVVKHGALDEPSWIVKAKDMWDGGALSYFDVYMNARRPVTGILLHVSPVGRVQSGSIPQGCCGGHFHYTHVDAPRLNMARAKETDIRYGAEITKVFRAYQRSMEGVEEATKSAAAARAKGDGGQVQFWENKATEAKRYADDFLSDVSRLDMFMTGVDPSQTDAVSHARNMLMKYPGVFVGVGELTINKEIVTVSLGKHSFQIDAPALKHFLAFAEKTGLVVLIHNDRGRHGLHHHDHRPMATQSADEHGDEFIAMIKKYPKLKAVWAHAAGFGRFVRADYTPTKVTVDINKVATEITVPASVAAMYRWAQEAPDLKLDLSWNDVGEVCLTDPRMRKAMVDFLLWAQDRVHYGSDTVMPLNKGMYNQALTTFLPLFKDIALRDKEALWKILRLNYDTLMDKASRDVTSWTESELALQGREEDIKTMNHMQSVREAHRETMRTKAREKFDAWVDKLYDNVHAGHVRDRMNRDVANDNLLADLTVQKSIENNYRPANNQHWVGEVHGAGTPGGNSYTKAKRIAGGAMTGGALVGALIGGDALLASASANGMAGELHATNYIARSLLNLTKAVGLDWMRIGWEQLIEEGRITNRNLDTLVNRIVRYGRAFNLPEARLFEVTQLAEQFRTNYAFLAAKEIDKATGWTKEHRFNVIMSEVGHFMIGIDRALGVQASSMNPFDPRTRPGQAVRAATAATLGVNVMYGAHKVFSGDLSGLSYATNASFTLANSLGLLNTSAGLGSGLAGFNWEERKFFRQIRAANSVGLSLSGVLWTAADIAKLAATGSVFNVAEMLLSAGFTYATARQSDVDIRKAFSHRSMHGPTPSSWPAYLVGANTIGRVALSFWDDEEDEQKGEHKGERGLGSHVRPAEQHEAKDAGASQHRAPEPAPVAPTVPTLPTAPTLPTVPPPALSDRTGRTTGVATPESRRAAKQATAPTREAARRVPADWPDIPRHPATATYWQDQAHIRGHHFPGPAKAAAAFEAAGLMAGNELPESADAQGEEHAEFDWVRPGDNLTKIAKRHVDELTDDGNVSTALQNLMAINAPIFQFDPALIGRDHTGKGDPDKIWPGMMLKVTGPH